MRRDTLELADGSLFILLNKIREHFGSTVATALEELSSPFIPTTDDRHLRRRDIHAILSTIGGVPRKAVLFITFRLLEVAPVPECYTVLGLLHAHFKPIPGTFDDCIGLPKDNGNQSIDTCVYPVREVSHKPIEFQDRAELMHMEAEQGTAAIWRYKSGTAAEAHDHYKARWMQGRVCQHATADSPDAFIRLLPRQCGIANFTTDLLTALSEENPNGDHWAVVVNDIPKGYGYPGHVCFEINQRALAEYRLAADFLNMSRVEVDIIDLCLANSLPAI